MKIRNGFVSNSSSSSFILFKAYLSPEQEKQIKNWKKYALSATYKKKLKKYALSNVIVPHADTAYIDSDEDDTRTPVEPFSEYDFPYYPDGWNVKETENIFDISTLMDNFDMEQFLNVIGVDVDKCGLRLNEPGSCCDVVGLNDAKTDLKDYFNDDHYFDNYYEYWYSSKSYREQMYPILKSFHDEGIDTSNKLIEPVEKKRWICEDAGAALNEATGRIYEVAYKYGCSQELINRELPNDPQWEKVKLVKDILRVMAEVKDNWREQEVPLNSSELLKED